MNNSWVLVNLGKSLYEKGIKEEIKKKELELKELKVKKIKIKKIKSNICLKCKKKTKVTLYKKLSVCEICYDEFIYNDLMPKAKSYIDWK